MWSRGRWLNPPLRARQCSAKSGVVVAVQGTRASNEALVCKELGIFYPAGGESFSHSFKPPEDLTVDPKVDYYVTKYLHGIAWSGGNIPYRFLQSMLEGVTRGRCCFTKGQENFRFLHSFGLHVHNLEDIGCPNTIELPFEEVTCRVEGHSSSHFCAERRAKQWGRFLLSQ